MENEQPPPIYVSAVNPDHPNPASIVFLHGYDDDAESYTGLISYIQTTYSSLSHISFILPTASLNHELRARAWYKPRSFSAIPVGRSSAPTSTSTQNENDEEDEEDTPGLLLTITNIRTILSTSKTPLSRIIVAGFSQGGAIALLLGLGLGTSPSSSEAPSDRVDTVAGVACLSGYLPQTSILAHQISQAPHSSTQFFVAHGTRDVLVPRWVATETIARVEEVVGKERVEERWYEGMRHVISGKEVGEWAEWVGRVLPA